MGPNEILKGNLGKGSNIRLEVCDTEVDLYWRVAIGVLEVIEENNKKGEPTVMVVLYGPVGPYSRLVYLVNKYRVSLNNCVFINMDEYLTQDNKYIDINHPLSFRGGMNRIFYDKIDEELNVRLENCLFPDPNKLDEPLNIIKKYGKLDMVFGGVGINGHYAFNEPPSDDEAITNEEFLNLPTRILKIARETLTINSFMNCGGDLDGIPKNCITVGMKEMFMAKKLECVCQEIGMQVHLGKYYMAMLLQKFHARCSKITVTRFIMRLKLRLVHLFLQLEYITNSEI